MVEDKCDHVWTEEAGIREYSPTYYVSTLWLKRILKNSRGLVLDIGSGDCSKVKHFVKDNMLYVGIDHSDIAVKKARGRGYEVYKMSATNFKFKQKFDLILLIDLLEHVERDEKVIKLCGKSLKENGKLVVSVPIHQKLWGDLDVRAGHVRRYDPDELVAMLERNGLKTEKIHFSGFPLCYIYRKLQYFLGRSKVKSKQGQKYVPKGRALKLVMSILPFILPLFRIDMLFSSNYFKEWSRGIIVVASKRQVHSDKARSS